MLMIIITNVAIEGTTLVKLLLNFNVTAHSISRILDSNKYNQHIFVTFQSCIVTEIVS